MLRKSFEYKDCDSGIFGTVKRPLISLDVRSEGGEWFSLRDVLADTGADVSIFPRDIGELVCDDTTLQQVKALNYEGSFLTRASLHSFIQSHSD
ncbi:MAG: hypothetical protein IMZ43_10360 [Thermoplasmata archaeon]|nr:hypothetical protein [Thermoplasmata archaeon]MBE3137774.1 hypothetical protein [Thermoplasmata archaeon]